MTVLEWLCRAGREMVDLLYPPRCAGCGRAGNLYCTDCRSQVPLLPQPVCSLCGQSLTQPGLCARCQESPLLIDGIRSAVVFQGTLRQAIHQLKYRYTRDMAESLGEMLLAFWQQNPLPADVLVPVPLHPRRIKERGYNQAALLAHCLGRAIHLPVLDDILYRQRYTASQTHLNAQQRRDNVKEAFRCVGSLVRGKRVVLIDDVCTTGATIEASSVALRQGGAVSVWGLTLARAQ